MDLTTDEQRRFAQLGRHYRVSSRDVLEKLLQVGDLLASIERSSRYEMLLVDHADETESPLYLFDDCPECEDRRRRAQAQN